ncbi:hypothetical protein [Thermopirellula anaerolimosa]
MWSTLKKIGNVVDEARPRVRGIPVLALILAWLWIGPVPGDEWRSRYETASTGSAQGEQAIAVAAKEGDSAVAAARHLSPIDDVDGGAKPRISGRKVDSAVVPAGYAGMEPTPQLRWLPVRPKAIGPNEAVNNAASVQKPPIGTADHGAEITEGTESSSALVPLQFVVPSPAELGGAASVDPLSDPFGDAVQPGPTLPPALLPRQSVSQSSVNAQPEVIPPPVPLGSTASQQQAESGQPSPDEKSLQELMEQLPPGQKDERPLEEQLTQKTALPADECPPQERIKPLSDITNNIRPQGDKFPTECPLPATAFEGRRWQPLVFTWKASGLCHKPLYFEQVGVERYGHNLGPILQPFASGAHFFLTVPILPYKMGLEPPDECVYTLGYYRPGSCAPWILDPLPLSVRAALAEGGVWTGMAFLIP